MKRQSESDPSTYPRPVSTHSRRTCSPATCASRRSPSKASNSFCPRMRTNGTTSWSRPKSWLSSTVRCSWPRAKRWHFSSGSTRPTTICLTTWSCKVSTLIFSRRFHGLVRKVAMKRQPWEPYQLTLVLFCYHCDEISPLSSFNRLPLSVNWSMLK